MDATSAGGSPSAIPAVQEILSPSGQGPLRKAFYATATEADLQAIARQVVEQAKAGNLGAIKIALLWLLGKPAEPTDLDVPAPTAQAF
jgi:hypothetical protein